MKLFFGSNVCRVCLIPGTVEDLSSLVDHGSSKAEIFQKIAKFDISDDLETSEALICDKCLVILEKCEEFICDARQCEELVFEPMREEFDAIRWHPENRNPDIDIFFEVCRICLMPISEGALKSLFEHRGKLSKMLILVTGVDVSQEENVHNALICGPCSKTMQRAVHLNYVINKNKTHYFDQLKAYRCLHCHTLFNRIDHLRRHCRRFHTWNENDQQTSSSTSTQSTTNKSAEKNSCEQKIPNHVEKRVAKKHPFQAAGAEQHFPCSFKRCNKRFKTKTSLSCHQAVHSTVRYFICWCKKPFKDSKLFKIHKMTCTTIN